MRTSKFILISAIAFFCISLSSCKNKEPLAGEIHGTITDASTSQPLQKTTVVLIPAYDTISTESDGAFEFKDLTAGNYEIEASKQAYSKKTDEIEVISGKIVECNLALNSIIVPKISARYLDFGSDSIEKLVTISYTGLNTLNYSVSCNDDWISVTPATGSISNRTETLTITIDRAHIYGSTIAGEIRISSVIGQDNIQDTVGVYVNGVMDRDYNYYTVIKIGSQIWMGQNLNVGAVVAGGLDQTGSQTIKRYCYGNCDCNCSIYGGLYTWTGMMQGTASGGVTQGVCPVGWHVPSMGEWESMFNYLDVSVAGSKIKETGTAHWKAGNVATNESGFTALPGGIWDGSFELMTSHEFLWTSTGDAQTGYNIVQLEYNSGKPFFHIYPASTGAAVRCVKDE